MNRHLNRILSLLLALVMVLSLSTGAFAADKRDADPVGYYKNYVAMGTSITGGYGIGSGGWGVPIAGAFGADVYPKLVADYFEIPNAGRYDGALLGTRTKEFRILLEDDFHGDDFTEGWADAKCGNSEAHLKQISSQYKSELESADLITVELGSNDIISVILFYCQQYLETLAEEHPEYADVISGAMGSVPSGGEETNQDLFSSMLALANELGFYADYLSYIMKLKDQAIADFKTNFDAIIADVRALNSEADIFCMGLYNPFPFMLTHEITNNDNASDTVKQTLLEAGKKLNLTTEQTVELVKTITDSAVNEMNNYIKSGCSKSSEYTYLDVSGIDLAGSDDGTHPGKKGHAYLAEHVENAILSKFECRHIHTTTKYAITPTMLTLGYTGDVVCAECGKTLSKGSIITYYQYLKQQKEDPIPEDPGSDDDPVFPPADNTGYPEEDYALLAFTSDVHNKTGNTAAKRLENWLTATQSGVQGFEFLGVCGDLAEGNGTATGDAYWNLAAPVIAAVEESGAEHYAITTGNHEHDHGSFSTTKNANAKKLQRIGAATVNTEANYKVYCFGAAGSTPAFTDEDITALDNYLKPIDQKIPVFVISHFPLHDITGRPVSGEEKVIDVLNNYPNVIFIWGHNHTEASSSEKHYDKVYTGLIDSTPINFTYAPAGCMSDSENNAGSASVKGKALLVTVSKEKDSETLAPNITLRYVDAGGNTVIDPVTIDITAEHEVIQIDPISSTYSFKKATSPQEGKQYIITYENGDDVVALDTTYCSGYVNANSYSYSGFKGKTVGVVENAVTFGVYEDMVWEFEADGNGFNIKNVVSGTYLNATYTSNGVTSSSKDGCLMSNDTIDTWTYSGGVLNSANSTKNLAFDQDSDITERPYDGVYDFFTVRSNGDAMTFYEVTGNPVECKAKPSESTEALSLVKTPEDGHKYVILSQGYALNTVPHDGYTERSGYHYSGFSGVETAVKGRQLDSYVYDDMIWTCTVAGGGYHFQNSAEDYLAATYVQNDHAYDGTLMISATPDIWTLNNGILQSKNATGIKDICLAYDTRTDIASGSASLFTVRSKSNATPVQFYDVTDETARSEHNAKHEPAELTDLAKVEKPGNGSFVIVYGNRAMTSSASEGYVNENGDTYKGLASKKVIFDENGDLTANGLTSDMVWSFVKNGSSYSIQNVYTGKFLNATYSSGGWGWGFPGGTASSGASGVLKLDDTTDQWSLKRGILTSRNAGQPLSYESSASVTGDYDGSLNFYTVRGEGSPVSFYYIKHPGTVEAPNPADLAPCTRWARSTAQKGTFAIMINGYAIGIENGALKAKSNVSEAAIADLDDAYRWKLSAGSAEGTWSICNIATNEYLGVYQDTDKLIPQVSLTLSNYAYDWNFDNSFYASFSVKSLLSSTNRSYYISCTNGIVSLTNSSTNKTANLFKAVTASNHSFVLDSSVEPTCTEPGTEIYRCTVCGDTYEVESAALLGHNHENCSEPATCTETGYSGQKCSRCGDVIVHEEIPALGHLDEDDDNLCDRCGSVMAALEEVDVKITKSTTTQRILFIKREVTTYSVDITPNVKTKKVEYSTNRGLTWKTASHFEMTTDPGSFYIRITEMDGTVTRWQYQKSSDTATRS